MGGAYRGSVTQRRLRRPEREKRRERLERFVLRARRRWRILLMVENQKLLQISSKHRDHAGHRRGHRHRSPARGVVGVTKEGKRPRRTLSLGGESVDRS